MRRCLVALTLAASACATAPSRPQGRTSPLPFFEDDYDGALALAKERKLPLFVDTWAPWCHSCLFLREHVLTRDELAPNAPRFVWLAVNTELPKNAAFLEAYPVENWPTLFIIDSATGSVALKWLGTATVPQLEKLFADGERAVKHAGGEDAAALLAQADALHGQGKKVEAAAAYARAVQKSDAGWDRRPRAVESWLIALWGAQQHEECTKVARAELPAMPRTSSFLNVSVVGLSCATGGDPAAPWRQDAVAALEVHAQEALKLEGMLADDRSGLYETLVDARSEAKDEVGAKRLALEWLDFLEAAAKEAPTPAARAAFDPHRVSASIAAGAPARAEAALKQSEQDFPDDYNPPARLALVYREQGKLDEALVAIDRALGKAYGPRKVRLYETRATVQEKRGDRAGQRATLEEAVRYGRALPASQRPEKTLARLDLALARLRAP